MEATRDCSENRKGAMATRGTNSVKYSATTRQKQHVCYSKYSWGTILSLFLSLSRSVRLPIRKREKHELSPEGSYRGPFFLSPSPRYLENIPGSSFPLLLRLFLLASLASPSVLSLVPSIRLLLRAPRFFSDYRAIDVKRNDSPRYGRVIL